MTESNGLQFLSQLERPALVAMIHVQALPGTPRGELPVADICRQAVKEAALYEKAGVDAIAIENMHDVPYLRRAVGPEIVASMTAVALAVREATTLPLGVQILAGANHEALAVAQAAGAEFIRCEGFVFGHVADEGMIDEADAGPLLRYRRAIDADRIAVLADIKKKHAAHALTSDMSLGETAKSATFFGADGVIVTGSATGAAAAVSDLQAAVGAIDEPVFVGSGITVENVSTFAEADGLIVGSYLKRDGDWRNEPDAARVESLVKAVGQLRR